MMYQKPDEKTIARMTPRSLRALIEALETRRKELTEPYDEQINYYKDLLKQKEAPDAKTAS